MAALPSFTTWLRWEHSCWVQPSCMFLFRSSRRGRQVQQVWQHEADQLALSLSESTCHFHIYQACTCAVAQQAALPQKAL